MKINACLFIKEECKSIYCGMIYIKMEEIDRQFWQAIRSFLIRYYEFNRQKGASPVQLDEFDQAYSKLLASRDLKEIVINKITTIQLKTDYHNLIMLALLLDLSKWSQQYYTYLREHSGPLDCILNQSISVLNSQQQYHTIVPKQNELISSLLSHPNTLGNFEQFKILYRRLKDIKEFYPSSLKDNQKQIFSKTMENCIEKCSQLQNTKILQYIFGNIFNELENLEQTHEYVSQRLKLLKKIIKSLWFYHQDILYKVAYLLMKYSYSIITNKHLFNNIIPIYEILQAKLIQKQSLAPLLIFKHIVSSNIAKILAVGGNCIQLQILLSQLASIFKHQTIFYFMKTYDWNYLEVPICQQSLNMLYEFTQNRANEKKIEYELIKLYINRIHAQIKKQLETLKNISKDEGKWKFYQLNKAQYLELIQEMNEKPKKIFKKIQSITSKDVRESIIMKYSKMIKKTAHLNSRSMIDIFSTDNKQSAQLFSTYVELVLQQCKENNLQEFMRLFTSNFFITGQSQQIARVMDTITQSYYSRQDEANRILKSSDATYTFANAILILNTDLHNPKNQEKISQQNFIKMCKKINNGEDLPLQTIKKTYNNIKKNKINNFRDRGDMIGISISNWLNICMDYESVPLEYYDHQLSILDQNCLNYFIYDVLSSIIDEKETAKLELLVQRFVYDDKVFQCEIIQTLRKIVDKKPHLPLHIAQKIMEIANFKNTKISDKLLSYYWLATNIIINFNHLIPTNIICQFLVLTWNLRIEIQDNLQLRQDAQMRRIRLCLKNIAKRQTKKSIIDMFSNFLSFKESDEEAEPIPNQFSKRNHFKSLSNNIFDILKYNDQHRQPAFEFLASYIHGQQSKLYQQFVSCLFLIFNLLYYIENCEKVAEDFFYQLLGVKQSSITKRLSNLGKKDPKLYSNIINYCKFWILKLLIKEYTPQKRQNKNNNNYQYLLVKGLEYLEKVDKQILNDIIKELSNKTTIDPFLFDSLDKSIKKIFGKIFNEVQFFYDKFKQKPEEKPSSPSKQQIKVLQEQNHSKQEQLPSVKSSIGENKQNLHHQNTEQNSQANNVQILKQDSVRQVEEVINPDQLIDKIEHQIESHSKKTQIKQSNNDSFEPTQEQIPQSLNPDQNQVDKPKEEQTIQQERKEQSLEEDKKLEQGSSIPVIMF